MNAQGDVTIENQSPCVYPIVTRIKGSFTLSAQKANAQEGRTSITTNELFQIPILCSPRKRQTSKNKQSCIAFYAFQFEVESLS